jgi:hypothetical protein
MAQNVVVYRTRKDATGAMHLQPLASFDPADPMLSAKMTYAAIREYRENDLAGAEHSDIRMVLESREADEGGRITKSDFQEIALTAEPKGKSVSVLSDLFKE